MGAMRGVLFVGQVGVVAGVANECAEVVGFTVCTSKYVCSERDQMRVRGRDKDGATCRV